MLPTPCRPAGWGWTPLSDDYDSLLTLYVATLNGLAQGIGQIMRALERGGYEFDMLVVSGGAARSQLVRQTIADVTGKKVGVPETTEPVLLGAAMLGAVAAGHHDVESAMSAMSRLAQEVTPAGGETAAYDAIQLALKLGSELRNPRNPVR